MSAADGKFKSTKKVPNPFLTANLFSRWSFWWTLALFRKGYYRPLKDEDIYEHKPSFDIKYLTKKFLKLWNDELKQKNPSIIRLIIKAYGLYFLPLCIGFALLDVASKAIQLYCLGYLISYFSQNNEIITQLQAYMYATGIVLSLLPSVLLFHPLMFYVLEIGLRVRLGLSALVYGKILKISKCAASDGLSAKAINVLSNDVGKFDYVFSYVADTFCGPMHLIVLSYFGYTEMGYSSFVGIGFLLLFIPIEVWCAKKAAKFHQKTAIQTDYRVKLMNEVIQGMEIIKMYAWEKSFGKILGKARKKELNEIRSTSMIYAFLHTTSIISKFAVFLTILTYLYTGDLITARKVFIISSIYDILNRHLIYFWPTGIIFMAQASISAKRISEVLLENENYSLIQNLNEKNDSNKISVLRNIPSVKYQNIGLWFENVSASWNSSRFGSIANSSHALNNFNVSITDNYFVGVIGPVGSGKTSFLNAILGEIEITEGKLIYNGNLSYASQESWIFEDSIRNNIIFTESFDTERYHKVLEVCALEKDLEILPYGDLTVIGERGISLSGGQKARINLARAIYRQADIYLLDDPLSAVDANVARHIFEKCFKEFLNNKIRILVTHQVYFLKDLEKIIIINKGHLEFQGNYKELQNFHQFEYYNQNDNATKTLKPKDDFANISGIYSMKKRHLIKDSKEETEDINENRKEKQEIGSLKINVFFNFFKTLENWIWFILIALLFITARGVISGVDYFISRWVIWEEENIQNFVKELFFMDDIDSSRLNMIIIYSSLLGTALLLYILRSFGFFLMCLQISLKLHDRMFIGITRASMYFFNINPSGRILNRFSKDMNLVDVTLPMTLVDCLIFFTDTIAIIVMVSIANYWLLIPAFLMSIIFYFLRNLYVCTSRSVKRIESISRSPIYSHINETFNGLTTVRGFEAQNYMEKKFQNYQNINASCWYMFLATTRAFVLWLDFLCLVYIGLVTYSFIVLENVFYSGDVGLAITQSISLITMFQWGLRQTAELENQMTSVERIFEYANEKSEPSLESTPENRPKDDWPSKGEIKFSNFYLKYSDDGEYILKNINFEIKAEEKIGIVGRTGAGKSSIIQSLFRLACNDGEIVIDGVDIGKLGLHDLRSKISIIPQDPVLFSGTLRYNLDPFEKSSDMELWNVLKEVELKEYVSSMSDGLSCKISDGGSNFSMGQRQLVCLARAILRRNKILILDEATANVDSETDKLIQKTIRTKFEKCTVLTIAHRLHTVMDSDRIFVVDSGKIVECGHPYELICNTDSYLKKLVDETGADSSKLLHDIAEEHFKK